MTGTTALNSELIAEKDKKIEALMREGKKLSDQSFKSSNINKKLQAKAKEADAAAVKMNARIKDAEAEIEKLQSKLAEKVKAEKEYQQSASKVDPKPRNLHVPAGCLRAFAGVTSQMH